MRYIISGKNIDITSGLREAVESKIGNVERIFLLTRKCRLP